MTASVSYISFSGVATPETAMGTIMKLPRGCLTIFTLRDAILPLVRNKGSHPAQHDFIR